VLPMCPVRTVTYVSGRSYHYIWRRPFLFLSRLRADCHKNLILCLAVDIFIRFLKVLSDLLHHP
jgi:hypothetical protein